MRTKCPYTGEAIEIVTVHNLTFPALDFVSPKFRAEYTELQLVQACIPEWRKVFDTFDEKIRTVHPVTGRTYVRWLYGMVLEANPQLRGEDNCPHCGKEPESEK